ncbi:MAG: hypothetical protein PF486_01195, partial [Prolixibacteraceae bacterium]|nr:hypothetical protein [Prolixibacteraceae bacterium]
NPFAAQFIGKIDRISNIRSVNSDIYSCIRGLSLFLFLSYIVNAVALMARNGSNINNPGLLSWSKHNPGQTTTH